MHGRHVTPARFSLHLPAVVPVLLHNGEHGWTSETSFEKLVKLPESVRDLLARHTPRFDALLVDLHPEHATPLKEAWLTAFGKLVLWALSVAGDNPRLLAVLLRYISATPHGSARGGSRRRSRQPQGRRRRSP